jgi:hypothetical protein
MRADARIRTADPFITSEVLYQLSYVGVPPESTERIRTPSNASACDEIKRIHRVGGAFIPRLR